MIFFLDTSVLLKLYFNEPGSEKAREAILGSRADGICLSHLAKAEFSSATSKKVRMGELGEAKGLETIELFRGYVHRYRWVEISEVILENARDLIWKHRVRGLRTLDAVHLAALQTLEGQMPRLLTSDRIFFEIAEAEGIDSILIE